MATKKTDDKNMNFFPVLSKYKMDEIKIEDQGLARYINLETENIYRGGVYSNKLFAKSKTPIIERFINNIMRTEHYNGKKTKAYKVVRESFNIIDKRTKTNPMQIFIDALQNAAPKEELSLIHI